MEETMCSCNGQIVLVGFFFPVDIVEPSNCFYLFSFLTLSAHLSICGICIFSTFTSTLWFLFIALFLLALMVKSCQIVFQQNCFDFFYFFFKCWGLLDLLFTAKLYLGVMFSKMSYKFLQINGYEFAFISLLASENDVRFLPLSIFSIPPPLLFMCMHYFIIRISLLTITARWSSF